MGLIYDVGDIVTLKKGTSMWKQGMGNPACGSRFSSEMYGMRTYDHGATQDGRKEYEESEEKGKLKKYIY